MKTLTRFLSVSLAALILAPLDTWACATCFGASDADLARGMNWGIFSLLFVVVTVLGGIASFFVYLGRRSAAMAAVGNGVEPSFQAKFEETHK